MFSLKKHGLCWLSISGFTLNIYSNISMAQSPSPTPVPSQCITDCSAFQEEGRADEFLHKGCLDAMSNLDDPPPCIFVIDGNTTADIIENVADTKWLILGDGRSGAIAIDELEVKNNQTFFGIPDAMGNKPILQHLNQEYQFNFIDTTSMTSDNHARRFRLLNFELDGAETDAQGFLLFVHSPKNVLVMNNTFKPVGNANLNDPSQNAIRWQGSCTATNLQTNVLAGNTIFVKHFANGLEVDCPNSSRAPGVTSSGNKYLLEQGSRGIELTQGGFVSTSDTFTLQSSPGNSTTYGIFFEEVHDSVKYNTQITGATFNGNEQPKMVAIKLNNFSSLNTDSVLISLNRFEDVEVGIEFSGNEIIHEGSTCNVWVEGSANDESTPCSGQPRQGYVHFTNGTVCAAEGASIPATIDCNGVVATTIMISPTSSTMLQTSVPDHHSTSSTKLIIPTNMPASNTSMQVANLESDAYAEYWAPLLVFGMTVAVLNVGSRLGMHTSNRKVSIGMQILNHVVSCGVSLGYDLIFHKGIFMKTPKTSDILDTPHDNFPEGTGYTNAYTGTEL